MDDEEDEDICKVVLLGESGVGKTSIISRFINGTFEERLMSTTGASYVCRNLTFPEFQNKMVKFEIWDTAGQEQYRALNKIFYKDASVCILVYDITNIKSFNALKEYWHSEVIESTPKGIVLGLAANKSDLDDKEEVPEEMARNFAKEINAVFMYTSAFKFIGIDELFHNIGCRYINPNYKSDESGGKNNIENKNIHNEKTNKKQSLKLEKHNNKEGEGKKKKLC